MRAIVETVFDIFYLVTVLTVGIRMIRGRALSHPDAEDLERLKQAAVRL